MNSNRLDTAAAARYTLDTDGAWVWLHAIETGAILPEFDAPSASEVLLDPTWTPRRAAISDELRASTVDTINALIRTASELGFLHAPDGIDGTLVALDEEFYQFQLHGQDMWNGLRLVSDSELFGAFGSRHDMGAEAALRFLMSFVDTANGLLSTLLSVATTVLAQYSTDPVLLTRLADNADPFVRHVAAGNPNTPDEARVWAALRDAKST
jgi:hypothetical protein